MPYSCFFSFCMGSGTFSNEWKMVPIHKRDDKGNVKNYRPISILSIFGKKLERLIYNEIYSFFIKSDLITPNQSSFKQGNSCINQLLLITHDI